MKNHLYQYEVLSQYNKEHYLPYIVSYQIKVEDADFLEQLGDIDLHINVIRSRLNFTSSFVEITAGKQTIEAEEGPGGELITQYPLILNGTKVFFFESNEYAASVLQVKLTAAIKWRMEYEEKHFLERTIQTNDSVLEL